MVRFAVNIIIFFFLHKYFDENFDFNGEIKVETRIYAAIRVTWSA